MTRAKLLEVRDEGTTIPVFALSITNVEDEEVWLKQRGGWTADQKGVYVGILIGGRCEYDPFAWDERRGRTMGVAHQYIREHFNQLLPGDVVDVRHILGETSAPVQSDRHYSRENPE